MHYITPKNHYSMKKLSLCLWLFAILYCFACQPDQAKPPKPPNGGQQGKTPAHFLSLSDIHFNPFCLKHSVDTLIKSEVSEWTNLFKTIGANNLGAADTDFPTFMGFLQQMTNLKYDPDFVVISGDYLSHGLIDNMPNNNNITQRDSFTHKTTEYVMTTLRDSLRKSYGASLPLFPVLGNNDSDCGDYMLAPNGSYLKAMAPLWLSLLKGMVNPTEFRQTFEKGGYYKASLPNKTNHTILALNSVLFSGAYQKPNHWRINYCTSAGLPDDTVRHYANEQLKWLKNELIAANGKDSVWIIYHIPPGIDAYSTVDKCEIKYYWSDYYNWQDSFFHILNHHSAPVTAQFAGHSHMDHFMLVDDLNNQPNSFIHITPAISSLFGNNPGFFLYEYDAVSTHLQNYWAYYSTAGDPNSWQEEYAFEATYGQSEITAQSLTQLQKQLLVDCSSTPNCDTTARKNFINYYRVEAGQSSTGNNPSAHWNVYGAALDANQHTIPGTICPHHH